MIRDALASALRAALTEAGIEPPAEIHLERPARKEHGDWSSNVAMATAKPAGRVPRELAGDLVERLNAAPPSHVERAEIAGPGFVNFHLRDSWLHDVLADVLAGGEEGYARLDLGEGKRVNVEFVSANPTGPIHAGGGRWAAFGDSLCRILERTGHVVHREYYLNDRGVQMGIFGASLAARKAGTPLPEDGYAGRVHQRVGGGDARRRRPGDLGLRASQARPAREPRRHRRRVRHVVQRAGPGRFG